MMIRCDPHVTHTQALAHPLAKVAPRIMFIWHLPDDLPDTAGCSFGISLDLVLLPSLSDLFVGYKLHGSCKQ